MAIYLPGTAEEEHIALDELTPREIVAELDKYVAEQRAKIQSNNDDVTKEKERFFGWRLKKQQEEKKISDAVAPFVTENPITTGAGSVTPAPKQGPKS